MNKSLFTAVAFATVLAGIGCKKNAEQAAAPVDTNATAMATTETAAPVATDGTATAAAPAVDAAAAAAPVETTMPMTNEQRNKAAAETGSTAKKK